MIRVLAILVGLAFVTVSGCSFLSGFGTWVSTPTEQTAEQRYHEHPKEVSFSSDSVLFGHFDRAQLQRGFQVYKEVCSGCHSLNFVAFRNLQEIGYSEAEVRAIADQWQTQVPSIDPRTGDANTRKATPADHFPSPFANETAARAANNNALPPDLSLITKAREGGAHYVYSILTGYQNPPRDVQVPEGLHFNPYFANLNIAMPPPLRDDGQVQYQDGTRPTVDQMAQDVSAFLVWTAEPNLETRHAVGLPVVLFLIFATVLAYLAYRNVWADRKKKKKAARA
jgi:ubiquinol-cytochrome c reductase cytochrome c1 subunit